MKLKFSAGTVAVFGFMTAAACTSTNQNGTSDAGRVGDAGSATFPDATSDGGMSGSADAGASNNMDASALDAATDAATCPAGASFDSDSKNCGRCGHDCLGGSCAGGRCQPVQLAKVQEADEITIDTNYVYWTAAVPGSSAIYRVPKNGGPVVTLVSLGQAVPLAIAVDSTSIYYTLQGSGSAADGSIWSCPVGGVAPDGGGVQPTMLYGAQQFPRSIAIDATNVYWTTLNSISGVGAVNQAPLAGGGTILPLAGTESRPYVVVLDQKNVYWSSDSTSGAVKRTPIGGGTITPLASTSESGNLTIDANNAYFSEFGVDGGEVHSVPLDGGVDRMLAIGEQAPAALVADQSFLYWLNNNNNTNLNAVALDGGSVITIAATPVRPYSIAIDATAIYWSNITGAVMKVAK